MESTSSPLTIGDLAARTGVPIATIRSWESRYGFPIPSRAPGGHRRYVEGDGDITLWHAKGCSQCANTGYVGRICITEMMPMTDGLRRLVMKHETAAELRAEAISVGMITMYEDGLRKAVKGVTTFEEVLRATRED